jgi:hypothetical protein
MDMPGNRLRLLLAGVLLPAVIVAADSLLLDRAVQLGWPPAATLCVFALFLGQTALLSWTAGRWLPSWPWRLLVLWWSTLVLNLLLYGVAITGDVGAWQHLPLLLVVAFLASQVGAGTVWAILGGLRWPSRWRLAAIALAPAGWATCALNEAPANVWLTVALIQTLAIGAVATLLHLRGYHIEVADVEHRESETRAAVQFSVQHMLVWTTCAAVLVTVCQALVQQASQDKGWQEWLQIAIYGIVLAIVELGALWTALGSGRSWLRISLATALAIGAGFLLRYLEAEFQARRMGRGYSHYWLETVGSSWLAWPWLAGALLAGLLLVLRATGYRLVRSKPAGR